MEGFRSPPYTRIESSAERIAGAWLSSGTSRDSHCMPFACAPTAWNKAGTASKKDPIQCGR